MATVLDRLTSVFERIDATLAEYVSMKMGRLFYEHLTVIVYKGGRGGDAVYSFACDKSSRCPSRIVEAFSGLPSTLIPRFGLEDHDVPYRIAVVVGNVEVFVINTRMSKHSTHLTISNLLMDTLEQDVMRAIDWLQSSVSDDKQVQKVEVDRQGDETVILHPGYEVKGVVVVLVDKQTGEVSMKTF